jgi:hypothetical protein
MTLEYQLVVSMVSSWLFDIRYNGSDPLLEVLRRQGFRSALAEIVMPNHSSVGLHEAVGFMPIGVHKGCRIQTRALARYRLLAARSFPWVCAAERAPNFRFL